MLPHIFLVLLRIHRYVPLHELLVHHWLAEGKIGGLNSALNRPRDGWGALLVDVACKERVQLYNWLLLVMVLNVLLLSPQKVRVLLNSTKRRL